MARIPPAWDADGGSAVTDEIRGGMLVLMRSWSAQVCLCPGVSGPDVNRWVDLLTSAPKKRTDLNALCTGRERFATSLH